MGELKTFWRLAALVAVIMGFGAVAFAGPANAADDSVWLCKPGIADNPCLGKFGGTSSNAGGSSTDLGYEAKADAPIDCFYVYPTQSDQDTPNADLSRDQELKDVAVNQARMFSRVCDVYAPVYRQYTFKGGPVTDEIRDIAYAGVLQGWKNYLKYYNKGRGVILIGHSQGSMHLGRLMQEEIDNSPEVRDLMISSIMPGANAFVPKGKTVGGQFQHIPTCEANDQLGCVIAYSAYLNEPPAISAFGRVESGYWINPMPRADPAKFEVMCVDPSDLTGGSLAPLANLSVFTGQPESEKPWLAQPDYYAGACIHQNGASWLNVSRITTTPPDSRLDLAQLIASDGGNLHLGDVNLAEDNLVSIASTEAAAYASREKARARLQIVKKRLAKAKKNLKSRQGTIKKLNKKLKKAKKHCRAKQSCKPQKSLTRRIKTNRKAVRKLKARIKSHKREIKDLNKVV
ncbi:MAG: DUF3089 domain-containing protein [Thermoleophilia bacterium]|nr:DUF3089 domain-containing protein [Thermoleophilia bacterium]